MKENFHTHTTRCNHASGTDEEYVLAAIEGGFGRLGFADHAPWHYRTGYIGPYRMHPDEFPTYRDSILGLKKKYAGQIDVCLGLEMEYFPRYLDHIRSMHDQGVYLIMGQHYLESDEECPYFPEIASIDDNLLRYGDAVAEGLSTGLYSYVAHPDLYMRGRRELDPTAERVADVICQAARENNVPLEYNLLGLNDRLNGHDRGYPGDAFWRHCAGKGVRAILGVDAHTPSALTNTALWDLAVNNLHDMGFTIQESIFENA